jgi:hypothetical protein
LSLLDIRFGVRKEEPGGETVHKPSNDNNFGDEVGGVLSGEFTLPVSNSTAIASSDFGPGSTALTRSTAPRHSTSGARSQISSMIQSLQRRCRHLTASSPSTQAVMSTIGTPRLRDASSCRPRRASCVVSTWLLVPTSGDRPGHLHSQHTPMYSTGATTRLSTQPIRAASSPLAVSTRCSRNSHPT